MHKDTDRDVEVGEGVSEPSPPPLFCFCSFHPFFTRKQTGRNDWLLLFLFNAGSIFNLLSSRALFCSSLRVTGNFLRPFLFLRLRFRHTHSQTHKGYSRHVHSLWRVGSGKARIKKRPGAGDSVLQVSVFLVILHAVFRLVINKYG